MRGVFKVGLPEVKYWTVGQECSWLLMVDKMSLASEVVCVALSWDIAVRTKV